VHIETNIPVAYRHSQELASLAAAQAAIGRGDLDGAIMSLRSALEPDKHDHGQSLVRMNLAAAFCQRAQGLVEDAPAINLLDEAASLLKQAIAALPARTVTWAMARTNLAVVLLTRGNRAQSPAHVLMAHLALDGTEEIFATAGDQATLDWSRAVRDHLTEIHERRTQQR